VFVPPGFPGIRSFSNRPVIRTDHRLRSIFGCSAGAEGSGSDPVCPVPGRNRMKDQRRKGPGQDRPAMIPRLSRVSGREPGTRYPSFPGPLHTR
jgi:hypothetical protein